MSDGVEGDEQIEDGCLCMKGRRCRSCIEEDGLLRPAGTTESTEDRP